MLLVYDIRRDQSTQGKILTRVQDQWKAYLAGQMPAEVIEGNITKVFYSPYQGEHMFRVDSRPRCAFEQLGDE